MTPDLILPSEIPWHDIKGSDLEELLYWLFDSMGAKDLEWRIGGKGTGAADQGRDLELAIFTPSPDGTLTKQIWWVEAKGRAGTVEASEVHQSVLNCAGKSNVEVLVIATNTNFSNPTRDWVKQWQHEHPRPIVKLWERTELENLCCKNPIAVIRLRSRALSPQGKVAVASTKLWDYASFSDEPTLSAIWEKREGITLDERALFALTASEFANGDIGQRSWALLVSDEILAGSLCNVLINFLYLAFRANESGVRQKPLIRAIAYLILVATQRVGPGAVSLLLSHTWDDVPGREYPERVREVILEPVLGILQAELKDVCVSRCRRVSTDLELLENGEVRTYWDRLRIDVGTKGKSKGVLIIESFKEQCEVGFPVGEEAGCPLCGIEKKPHSDIAEFIHVVDRVVRYRSGEGRDV